MKPDIHPKSELTTFKCSCGAVHELLSAVGGEAHLEICSQCHPYFSGKSDRMVDSAGRIDKFKRRYQNVKTA